MQKQYKVCYINAWAGGSTGNIVKNISEALEQSGFESCFISKEDFNKPHALRLGYGKLTSNFLRLWTRLKGNDGFTNSLAKHKLFDFLDSENPDLICINNIHYYFINIEHIFKWAKGHRVPIVWVLHDCWLLTGRCGYPINCDKWHSGCTKCPHKEYYPRTIIPSDTGYYWAKKRKMVVSYDNVLFCPVSDWLNSEFKIAYPNAKSVVMKNPLDLDVFYNQKETLPVIQEKSKGRKVIGLASDYWTKEKGLFELIEFSKRIDSSKYTIFCAGRMPADLDLPPNIYSLGRLNGKAEMSKFFRSLDFFVNFTLMDNNPTVNIEALSSGVPVLSYDSGGACSAIIDGKNGFIISPGTVDRMLSKMEQIDSLSYSKEGISKSTLDYLSANASKQYASLFLKILKDK